MFSCLQILEAFLWFVLITLLNFTLIILSLRSEVRGVVNDCVLLDESVLYLTCIQQKSPIQLGLGIPAEPLFRSLGTISRKTVKLMVLALICLGNNRQD